MSPSQSSLRSVGVLTICSFIQIVLQFGIQLVLARQFGTTNEMDAYNAAMSLPTALSAILVGSLNAAFVPVYINCRLNDCAASAHRFSSQLGLFILAASSIAAVINYYNAEFLMSLLHRGFDESQTLQAAEIFRVLTWLTITNCLTSYFAALHHGEKRFRTPAYAGLVGIGLTLLLMSIESYRTTGLGVAHAVLIGSIVCVILQSKLFIKNISWSFKIHPEHRTLAVRFSPIIVGLLVIQAGQLIDRYLASDEVGSIAQLGYAVKIILSVQIILSGFSVVVFPTLSEQHATNQRELFISEVAHSWRFLAVVLIPVCAGLGIFSGPIIHDLFQRGEFTHQDTNDVAMLTVLYLGFLIGSSIGTIASQTLNALRDTLTPTIISVATFPIAIWLKFQFGSGSSLGAFGIAAVTSLTYIIGASANLFVIQRRVGLGIYIGLIKTLIAVIPSTCFALCAAAVVIQLPIRFNSLIAAPIGALVYLLFLRAFQNEFAIRFMGYITEKINTRSIR